MARSIVINKFGNICLHRWNTLLGSQPTMTPEHRLCTRERRWATCDEGKPLFFVPTEAHSRRLLPFWRARGHFFARSVITRIVPCLALESVAIMCRNSMHCLAEYACLFLNIPIMLSFFLLSTTRPNCHTCHWFVSLNVLFVYSTCRCLCGSHVNLWTSHRRTGTNAEICPPGDELAR